MCHPSQATRLTTPACQEREHHGIPGPDFDNIGTYALNDSCAFVSEHDWLWHRVALVTRKHICVAQARGHDPDQYFVSAWSFQSYLEENTGAVDLKLSDDDVARLEAALRPEAVSGSRYNEKIMAGVDR